MLFKPKNQTNIVHAQDSPSAVTIAHLEHQGGHKINVMTEIWKMTLTSNNSSQLTTVPCGVWAITSGIVWVPRVSGVADIVIEVEKLEAVDAKDDDLRTWNIVSDNYVRELFLFVGLYVT